MQSMIPCRSLFSRSKRTSRYQHGRGTLLRHVVFAVLVPTLWIAMQSPALSQQVAAPDKDEPVARLERVQQPFLWKIPGEKPSYLFGTIHISDPRITTLHPTVERAFESADMLFIESAPEDQLKQLSAMMLKPDQRLEDLVSESMIKRIDKQLADISPVLSHNSLQVQVWAWPLLLPSLEVQMRNGGEQILDMLLVERAQKAGKRVGGLEDPVVALSGMAQLKLEEQIEFLNDTLDSLEESDSEGEEIEAEIAELYLKGEMADIEKFFEDDFKNGKMREALVDKIIDAMLISRNKRMAETIANTLKKSPDKSFFFAAGTAHFVVGKTVQDFLKEQGIEVVKIRQ